VLNGAYIYNKSINKAFARTQLLKFCTYYNNNRIGEYITVLVTYGYLDVTGKYKQHDLYSISNKGLQVIEELNNSYTIELNKFVDKYNVSI
jgi:predicted transcriptional regulator